MYLIFFIFKILFFLFFIYILVFIVFCFSACVGWKCLKISLNYLLVFKRLCNNWLCKNLYLLHGHRVLSSYRRFPLHTLLCIFFFLVFFNNNNLLTRCRNWPSASQIVTIKLLDVLYFLGVFIFWFFVFVIDVRSIWDLWESHFASFLHCLFECLSILRWHHSVSLMTATTKVWLERKIIFVVESNFFLALFNNHDFFSTFSSLLWIFLDNLSIVSHRILTLTLYCFYIALLHFDNIVWVFRNHIYFWLMWWWRLLLVLWVWWLQHILASYFALALVDSLVTHVSWISLKHHHFFLFSWYDVVINLCHLFVKAWQVQFLIPIIWIIHGLHLIRNHNFRRLIFTSLFKLFLINFWRIHLFLFFNWLHHINWVNLNLSLILSKGLLVLVISIHFLQFWSICITLWFELDWFILGIVKIILRSFWNDLFHNFCIIWPTIRILFSLEI